MGKKRYLYAAMGVVVMLFAGFVYAWSILVKPIAADFGVEPAALSLTFTICMAFFCLGGMAAGFLAKKFPVRLNMITSAVLFLVGFFLTSRAASPAMLYLCYGVLCGAASGFSYNSVMNVVPRWFPNQQGTISGVLLMGFGASSMIIGSVFTAVNPAETGGWRATLLALGVIIALVVLAGSFFFVPPREGEVPAPKKAASGGGLELKPNEMLARPSFWLFFLWSVLISAEGLVIIGQASTVAETAAPAMDAGAISFIVGLISICNGLGRVIFGALFDRIGRRLTMLLVLLCPAIGVGAVWLSMRGSVVLLVIGFVFMGLGYGGGPTMSASVTKQFYGAKNYAVNFSFMNLNLLVASFANTVAGSILVSTGNNFAVIFTILYGLIGVALALYLLIREA